MLRHPTSAAAAVVLVAATLVAACTGKYQSTFSIIVVNRGVNAISVLANGGDVGQVAAGQQGTFNLTLDESGGNIYTNGVAPTPQADVVVSAKDVKTGALSLTKSVTVTQGSPTYVTFSTTDFPSVAPTVARFTTSPTNPGVNQDVFFNATSSTANNATYTWDFGDGKSGSGVTVTHQYTQPGTFTTTLTVVSDNGQQSSSSRTVSITANLAPTAATFNFSPTNPAINQDVSFTATAVVAGQVYAWDFGDSGTGQGGTTTHRYTRASTYTVTLRVTNAIGQSATSSRTVTVAAGLATGTVNFTFSPTSPAVNEDVFFNAASTTVANPSFSWDFGDGSRGTGVTPTHRYAAAGTFTVTLTVTNDLGQSATTSKTITVSNTSATLVADFSFSPVTPGINDDVFFNASASTGSNLSFSWDFGDGSSGTGLTPTHRYTTARTFAVTLTVTNGAGQSATVSKTVAVGTSSGALTADFTFSPTDPSIGSGTNKVIFDATPSIGAATSWTWDFGDGSATASGKTVTHTFTLPATWVVRLTIADASGRTATTTKAVKVSP